MRHLLAVTAVTVLATLPLAGCGGDASTSATSRPDLKVSAAASLQRALTAYGEGFDQARARFSFAGSDELAAQIRAGGRPDVYAAANAKLPDALHAEGLVDAPVAFARNRLTLAVPAHGGRVASLADLARPGVTLAIGSPTVPIGAYTRTVLDRLPAGEGKAILANARSQEPDVAGIVGKVSQGAVDAGFVYVSDVRASKGALKAIALPDRLQPEVTYEAAVVRGTRHAAAARAFVAGLVAGAGQRALLAAGFLPPGAQ
ncbi:MAG: molybdate transport system substrate-binding protein [Solirubrobacteraceae bacterium]|jgi:molybdate transport system substrate-binding protein|nr:molybdate transport system substrate-binding protein [Solirubrobacteraceae bacterium]